MVAPEPCIEPSQEPSAATAHAREAPATADVGGGGRSGEFFDALSEDWRLTARQRTRLAPAIEAALNAGWTPLALAAFTGGNAGGVQSPYAVLASRLSPAELPTAPGRQPQRPPRCGACDKDTRMLGFDGDAPRPCPQCKGDRIADGPVPTSAVGTGVPSAQAVQRTSRMTRNHSRSTNNHYRPIIAPWLCMCMCMRICKCN